MAENNPVVKLPVPDSVQVMAWALVAGFFGHPISIHLLGISGHLKTQVCRTLTQWVGEPNRKMACNKKDIKNMLANIDCFKLAIFTDANLFSYAEWKFENTFDKNARNRRAGPVLLLLDTEEPDEPTGPLLKVHCAPLEIGILQNWLKNGTELQPYPQYDNKPVVLLEPRNDALRGWADPDQFEADLLILESLLLGASLIGKKVLANQTRVIDHETYVTVKTTLQSVIFQPPGCNFSPRLTFMVSRANWFLKMKYKYNSDSKNVSYCDFDVLQSEGRITFREMVDLGNPKGKTVWDLVAYLRNDSVNGLKKFISCGLSTKVNWDNWPNHELDAFCKLLVPWSPKQVRTEFSKAVKSKFLTAVRSAANQPFLYRLPESFTKPLSPFGRLPDPEALNFPLGSIGPPAPVSPSLAQSSGQMETINL